MNTRLESLGSNVARQSHTPSGLLLFCHRCYDDQTEPHSAPPHPLQARSPPVAAYLLWESSSKHVKMDWVCTDPADRR